MINLSMFGVISSCQNLMFFLRHRCDSILYDELKLEEFINKEEMHWNKDVITTYLGEEMVNIISGQPLSKMGLKDKLIWEANTKKQRSPL